MCSKSPAKILRSVKRMTKFLEKKQEALSVTILPSIDIYPLAKPISLSPTFSVNIWPSEFLPIDPQPDNQPIAAKTLPNSGPSIPEPPIPEPPIPEHSIPEPPIPEPPDDDILTKDDFLKIMEKFKKETSNLFELKLNALSS
jgi:hypothetical protein